ncbi:MAG: hypothetical protein PHW96_02030 [Candidatus Nanoarchaeia archaeon]|nr:hypothetical protein [Candidatus Nanoarchaeia archaeon]
MEEAYFLSKLSVQLIHCYVKHGYNQKEFTRDISLLGNYKRFLVMRCIIENNQDSFEEILNTTPMEEEGLKRTLSKFTESGIIEKSGEKFKASEKGKDLINAILSSV